jgi:hypothetical protein
MEQFILQAPPFCTICQTDCTYSQALYKVVKCGHIFHCECMDKWYKRLPICPNCKTFIRAGPRTYTIDPRLKDIHPACKKNADTFMLVFKFSFIQLLLRWFSPIQYENLKEEIWRAAKTVVVRSKALICEPEGPPMDRNAVEEEYESLVPIIQEKLHNTHQHPRAFVTVQRFVAEIKQNEAIAQLCAATAPATTKTKTTAKNN